MQAQASSIAVLFCCMGNICRSPTAEGVFRSHVIAAGLQTRVRIDSAGTHSYHVGHAPDLRSQAAAAARGYKLGDLRARQIEPRDFVEFDYILAMDNANLLDLASVAPRGSRTSPRMFMEFAKRHSALDVPDPYYGGADGFEQVLDMVEEASAGLLLAIKKELDI
jgi:protein-tyrosine phosphatase